jgi:hypothetical protein
MFGYCNVFMFHIMREREVLSFTCNHTHETIAGANDCAWSNNDFTVYWETRRIVLRDGLIRYEPLRDSEIPELRDANMRYLNGGKKNPKRPEKLARDREDFPALGIGREPIDSKTYLAIAGGYYEAKVRV